MASLRKKYQGIVDQSPEPVTTAPTSEVAKLPPVSDAPKPAEETAKTEPSPADEAAKSAIQERLAEAARAAEIAKEVASQQPTEQKFATEPPQQQMDPAAQFEQMVSDLPERMRDWYRVDPQFLEERAAQVQYAHHVVRRELGEEFTDPYYDRMEYALGLRHAAPLPEPRPLPERKVSAPTRQQSGPPVSAPPSRESHSMSTGRPVDGPASLTGEEKQLARTLNLTDEQYRKGKERMLREKAGGFHQHD
jgi:hypothetical protein